MEPLADYKNELSAYFGMPAKQISLFAKGRVGLYGLLKSLGVEEGDEVIIPAFTCVVVANAVLYLGATPIYCDINPQRLTMDPTSVAHKISLKTKVIIAQNTLGCPPDYEAIWKIAREHKLHIIEDCTHGMGSQYKGQESGTLAEASFFSTQWNKPFSTAFGGFVVVKSASLAEAMRHFEEHLNSPSMLKKGMLRLQYFARNHLLTPAIYWPAIRAYRWLSKKGLVSGSSAGIELQKAIMPADYLEAFTPQQARWGLKALASFEKVLANRQAMARVYATFLSELDLVFPALPEHLHHSFLRFPLLVKDRKTFMENAARARIPLGDWMNSPLHPVQGDLSNWAYTHGEAPIAEFISRHIVNLPTDWHPDSREAKQMLAFLRETKEALLPYSLPS